MADKKRSDILALVKQQHELSTQMTRSLQLAQPSDAIEQEILRLARKQALQLDMQHKKGLFATHLASQTQEVTAEAVQDSLFSIHETFSDRSPDPVLQERLDAVAKHLSQVAVRDHLLIQEAVSSNITSLVRQSIDPPPQPAKKPGLWERLFG